MTIRLLTLAALALAAAAPAQARDWELVAIHEGHIAAMFVDADAIRVRDDGMREAPIMITLREDRDGVAMLQSQLLIDCNGRRKRSLRVRGFDASEKLIAEEPEEVEWVPMTEGSLYGLLLTRVCDASAAKPGRRFGAALPIAAVREGLKNQSF